MNDSTVVSNEAEFERWLIAALQHERRRLFEAAQLEAERRRPATETGRNAEPQQAVSWTMHFPF